MSDKNSMNTQVNPFAPGGSYGPGFTASSHRERISGNENPNKRKLMGLVTQRFVLNRQIRDALSAAGFPHELIVIVNDDETPLSLAVKGGLLAQDDAFYKAFLEHGGDLFNKLTDGANVAAMLNMDTSTISAERIIKILEDRGVSLTDAMKKRIEEGWIEAIEVEETE